MRSQFTRRNVVRTLGCTTAALAGALTAPAIVRAASAAEFYRGKTLRILVGSPPGGGYDVYARLVAPALAQKIGAEVLVENKPGNGGLAALATLLTVLWVFREFTYIWVLTGGGPVRATETLAVMTYREAFSFFQMGFAAAVGVVTLLISTVASILFIRQSGFEFY